MYRQSCLCNLYIYIYISSNAVLTFSSVFRTIRSLSCAGTKFQSRLVTSLFTARKGTATRINDPQVQREINKDVACYASATSTKRYVVACFPREMISRGLKWGVKSPRRRYLAVCVPRTGCNGAIITRRTIVCVDKKEGEEVETASS